VTGNPGAGKSTLVNQLLKQYRQGGRRVGVVCIDPSSPFSGGAILGDRIRMQDHCLDEGVFIRSVATRGHLGGLSRSTDDIVNIMDAMGFDVVIVETVGVGQDEIDIVRTAHTSVVVLVPGLGDEIQALKAGILEIADIFVINKADREGADRTVHEIEAMLALRDPTQVLRLAQQDARFHHQLDINETAPTASTLWHPPVLKTSASSSQGIVELVDSIDLHHRGLVDTGLMAQRSRHRAREVFLRLLREATTARALQSLGGYVHLEVLAERIATRVSDPYSELAAAENQLWGA
jgi:LAO/AO transport system kinase